jgi:hypothetical protein
MKKLFAGFIIIAAALCSGCFGPDVAKAIQAMGNDSATVHLRVSSVYGVVELSRTNPHTNSLGHTVAPDGTITVQQNVEQPAVPAPLRGATLRPQ